MVPLESVGDWLAFLALLITLGTLAWSALGYIRIQTAMARQREFENFFKNLERMEGQNHTMITQAAAAFELRHYPRYRELTLRLCEDAREIFSGTMDADRILDQLDAEFRLTAAYLKRGGRG